MSPTLEIAGLFYRGKIILIICNVVRREREFML